MPDVIEARKDRWREFVRHGAPPGFMFLVNYADPAIPRPLRVACQRDKVAERIEWAWTLYEGQRRKAAWVHDDRLPYLSNVTGTEIFAEAFGCVVHYPEDNKPFALPCVSTPAEADALRVPELSTSSLAYLFDIADELRRRGGPDALIKPVDIQSPMDIAALIWDKGAFYPAMLDAPDAVRALAAKVRTLLMGFMDEWFRRYGTEYIAHYPDYLMCGGITLSEDEIGAVSAEMFDTFFREELVALSEHYGGLGIHCCADARHQWENLASLPGLRVLNLCKPPTRSGEEYTRPAYDFFDGSIVQMHHGWTPAGPPASWPAQYPAGRRVVLQVDADNRDEAIRIADELNAVREQWH